MGTDIAVPDVIEADLGPAMKALTPLQRRFVRAVQMVGYGRHLRAAKLAGYSGNDASLAVAGHNLSRNPKITAALVEEGGYSLQMGVDLAVANIIDVAQNPEQKKSSVKLKASLAILDRVGLPMKTEHTVNVNKNVSDTEEKLLTAIRSRLLQNPNMQIPLPIQRLLEARKIVEEVVDVEAVEVLPDPDADLLGE